jgi:hypothetical protein
MPVTSRALSVLCGLAAVPVWLGMASGQSQPLPLPTRPGGAAPPIYTQPQPSPATPAPPGPETHPREMPRAAEPVGRGDGMTEPSRPRIPQITSFPELTRGIGNSEALLEGVDRGPSKR